MSYGLIFLIICIAWPIVSIYRESPVSKIGMKIFSRGASASYFNNRVVKMAVNYTLWLMVWRTSFTVYAVVGFAMLMGFSVNNNLNVQGVWSILLLPIPWIIYIALFIGLAIVNELFDRKYPELKKSYDTLNEILDA